MLKHRYIDRICIAAALAAAVLTILFMYGEKFGITRASADPGYVDRLFDSRRVHTVDIQVENALLKRALGYEYMEERVEISEKDGRKVIQMTKTVPPDTTAQIFWLKNRRPDQWRDKPVEGAPEVNQTEDDALTESLKELARGL